MHLLSSRKSLKANLIDIVLRTLLPLLLHSEIALKCMLNFPD